MQKCNNCGAEAPDDAEKCQECGRELGSAHDTLMFRAVGDWDGKVSEEKGRIYGIEFDYTSSIGMGFKKIAAGEFMMGTEEWPDSKPHHKVTISKPFYMAIYPVTQKEWSEIVGKNPSHFKGDDRPVECVSWNDCQIFIKNLNKKEGDNKYRLPTEAEWEYCCRANTDTDYSFGDELKRLGEYAWYYDNSQKDGTHPIGTKLPNPWELCDLHGNVWEWCHDLYSPYSSREVTDPKGASKGSVRVHRGGSWCNDSLLCSSVFRRFNNPNRRRNNLGFRLVITI